MPPSESPAKPLFAQLFALRPRPSKAQLRFEERYAGPLGSLRRVGFAFAVSPVEAGAPNAHFYPNLARCVEQAGAPWRWVSVSHEKAGLLGQLALFSSGTVRDESGTRLDQAALLDWSSRQMDQATRRILHQNRLIAALNEQSSRRARRELPWVRTGTLVAAGALLLAAGIIYAREQGQLRGGDAYLDRVVPGVSCVLAYATLMLFCWWRQLRKRLAEDAAEDAAGNDQLAGQREPGGKKRWFGRETGKKQA